MHLNFKINPIMKKAPFFKTMITLCFGWALFSCSQLSDPTPTSSTLTYTNSTYTPIEITLNGQFQTIQPGSNLKISGKPGETVSGTASTSGKTTSGIVLGNTLTWTINDTYPASGDLATDLYVGTDYFFLGITNNSSSTITKVFVNYGLQNQTSDNLSIPGDGKSYRVGYYKAFTNSNVRAEAANVYWTANSLNLPFTKNQSYSLAVN